MQFLRDEKKNKQKKQLLSTVKYSDDIGDDVFYMRRSQ